MFHIYYNVRVHYNIEDTNRARVYFSIGLFFQPYSTADRQVRELFFDNQHCPVVSAAVVFVLKTGGFVPIFYLVDKKADSRTKKDRKKTSPLQKDVYLC